MAPPNKKRKIDPAQNKKRKTEPKVEEITFDLSARQDYLTGFHKRKLQRAKFAKEKAVERERLERIEHRKQIRQERKEDLEKHVQAVNELLGSAHEQQVNNYDSDDSGKAEIWDGIEDKEPEPVDHEAEYIDEDKYTTVTVEAMDVTREGLVRAGEEDSDEDGKPTPPEKEDAAGEDEDSVSKSDKKNGKRPWAKDKPKDNDKVRKPRKKRNFRYEGKLDRKANRFKQKRKNSEQAKARRSD